MKFSTSTLAILKNFSQINPSIYFRKGNCLKTLCVQETILAKADIEDEITTEFCVYDLPRFMNTLALYDDPEIEVNEHYATIGSGKSKIKYTLAAKNTIKIPPDKDISLPEAEVVFSLSEDMLEKLIKAIGVLNLPDIAIVGDSSSLTLQSLDAKNKIHDNYIMEIGETDKTFKVIIRADKLKFIPMDYVVSIARRGKDGLAYFKGSDFGLEYWVSIESGSTFDD